jgi:hypothetical protein
MLSSYYERLSLAERAVFVLESQWRLVDEALHISQRASVRVLSSPYTFDKTIASSKASRRQTFFFVCSDTVTICSIENSEMNKAKTIMKLAEFLLSN